MRIEFLDKADILEFHQASLRKYGWLDGIRDHGLLLAAIGMPEMHFDWEFIHCDIFDMAAAYAFHLVCNHPFLDGNKRTGVTAALTFLKLNGHATVYPQEQLEKIIVAVAAGNCDKSEIAKFFREL